VRGYSYSYSYRNICEILQGPNLNYGGWYDVPYSAVLYVGIETYDYEYEKPQNGLF
jgi:hypothetical protein